MAIPCSQFDGGQRQEKVSLIFLGIEESFFKQEGRYFDESKSTRKIIPSSVAYFESLIEKTKSVANVKIVVTSSWGKRAKNLEELKSDLKKFSFQDRVIDSVSYSDTDFALMLESEKIRQWIKKNCKNWDIQSVLVVGSFQLLNEIGLRFPKSHCPELFTGNISDPSTKFGRAFSESDIDTAYRILTEEPFLMDSLKSWTPVDRPDVDGPDSDCTIS